MGIGIALGGGMRRVVQSIGGAFAVISFTLLLVCALTTNWLEIGVNRDLSPAVAVGGLATYSRVRGLYKECWTDENLQAGTLQFLVSLFIRGCKVS